MTPEEQLIHLVDRLAKLERDLEQERQDSNHYQLEVFRVRRERNDARVIIDATLKALPVGYIPAHTPESLPGRVADLVSELGRLTAMIEDPEEVELAMIRGDIAIPDGAEFDRIRETPVGYNPSPTNAEINAKTKLEQVKAILADPLAVRIYSDDGPNDWRKRDLDQIDNEEHEQWIESQKPLD
jgi:hypothetical protein